MNPDGTEYESQSGFAVGTPERYASPELAFAAASPGQHVGYWVNPVTGDRYVDVVDVYPHKSTAIVAARSRGELAIYDFAGDTLITIADWFSRKAEG